MGLFLWGPEKGTMIVIVSSHLLSLIQRIASWISAGEDSTFLACPSPPSEVLVFSGVNWTTAWPQRALMVLLFCALWRTTTSLLRSPFPGTH